METNFIAKDDVPEFVETEVWTQENIGFAAAIIAHMAYHPDAIRQIAKNL
jgi:hypothetical protein